MDGENNGKPYFFKWDDFEGLNPLFVGNKNHVKKNGTSVEHRDVTANA